LSTALAEHLLIFTIGLDELPGVVGSFVLYWDFVVLAEDRLRNTIAQESQGLQGVF
jgi:hypothetical protein